jgi:uncharacterized membrane protein
MVAADRNGLGRTRAADPHVRGRVNRHAVLMSLMAGAAVLDLALRCLIYPNADRMPGIVLAITLFVLALSLVGGDLGGRLTYRLGVGVRSQCQGPEN